MKQKEFNDLANSQIDVAIPNPVATLAWKRGYLYAMKLIQEKFGDEIAEISCLADFQDMLNDTDNLHE